MCQESIGEGLELAPDIGTGGGGEIVAEGCLCSCVGEEEFGSFGNVRGGDIEGAGGDLHPGVSCSTDQELICGDGAETGSSAGAGEGADPGGREGVSTATGDDRELEIGGFMEQLVS